MNKYKKIAIAVVSTVMAGTMVVSITACGNGRRYTPPSTAGLEEGYKPQVDKEGLLTYTDGIELNTLMGYDKADRGITYPKSTITEIGGSTADTIYVAGKAYVTGDLKPAWQYLSNELKITVKDTWVDNGFNSAGTNISEAVKRGDFTSNGILTASSTSILAESINGTLLDLNKYLDFMPNYRAFLASNAVTRLSVTADTETGAMYMIPYFDGNNDVEKYVLMRKDIVEKLLDSTDISAATGTFASQATAKNNAGTKGVVTVVGTQASVKPFMGNVKEDNYTVDVTDPAALTGDVVYGTNKSKVVEAKKYDTVKVTLNYDEVIKALGDTNSDLYKAVVAAGVATPQKASGNIVAIQNEIINTTNGTCTGAQLTKVLQEYIKVAYRDANNAQFYTKLSDVFNSAYAAWDVDLYVALGRCAVSSGALLGNLSKGETAYFLGSRTGYTNRTYDIASMAGELYGVRGFTSRYTAQYSYINNKGEIIDARTEEGYWNALANMSALAKEGLYYTGEAQKDGQASIADVSTNPDTQVQFYSSTDYSQTQTRLGGYIVDGKITGKTVESGYNYAPILTPVSRWDVDGDGKAETTMRFTESWRGVKDGGLCLSKEYFKDQPEKLSAALSLIDWMFSNDGQMVLTYGPFSAAGNVTRDQGAAAADNYGTWYGTPYTEMTFDQAKSKGYVDTYDDKQYYATEKGEGLFFVFGNKLYSGTYYNGRMVPVPTDESYSLLFSHNEGKFTDYARQVIGSALNFGNKDQGFEAQCTPVCGVVGCDIWAIASVNGTIKHTTPGIDPNNYWYTLVPTVLPFEDSAAAAMKSTYQKITGIDAKSTGAALFYAKDKIASNTLTDFMYYGFDTSKALSAGNSGKNIPENAAGMVKLLTDDFGLVTCQNFMQDAWAKSKAYYIQLTSKK